MTHVTCRLTAKNWDQLRNPTLGNRVLATFLISPAGWGHSAIPRSVRFLIVCLFHGAAALGVQLPLAIGTLAACSLAVCEQRTRPRTDVDPPRVELPSAGAYRLAAPGAITCRLNALVSVGTGIEALKIGTTYYKNILVS